MVRKKRKAVVPDASAASTAAAQPNSKSNNSKSRAQPARVLLAHVEPHVPIDAPLAFALTIAEVPNKPAGVTPTDVVRTLQEWYTLLCDASNLYDQLKLLQLFRSKLAKALTAAAAADAPDDATTAFTTATWTLLFRLYVSPHTDALRKNVFLVLDVLARHDAMPVAGTALSTPLQLTASAELQCFLDSTLQPAESYGTPDANVDALDALLLVTEFPFVARVLVNDSSSSIDASILRTLRCCAAHLAVLAAPIAAYRTEAIAPHASTNGVLVASERCGHALKNVLALCSMREFLHARLTQLYRDANNDDAVVTPLRQLLGDCVVLLQTSVAHKDLLTQAGFAFCLILRLLLHVTSPTPTLTPATGAADNTTLLLHALTRFDCDCASDSDAESTSVDAFVARSIVASFRPIARLAVYRGLLNSLSDAELAAAPSPPTSTSVLDALCGIVARFCVDASLSTRLFAFQVLETFGRRAVALAATGSFWNLLAPATLETLTSLVLRNWEHPSKRVNQFMAQLFTHIVAYYKASGSFEVYTQWQRTLAAKLVTFPVHSRGKYGALTLLSTSKGSAQALVNAHPTLLQSVLHAVGHEYVSAAAAGLFAQLLHDLLPSLAGDKSAWRALWLDDVVCVLLSTDAALRSRIAMYVVPLLLKQDPQSVAALVNALALEKKDASLWAILEILKLARKRLAPVQLTALATTADAAIATGLVHADAATRSAAFDALCASLKSTTMPSVSELELLQLFLMTQTKAIPTTARMNTMIGLKHVLLRVYETLRLGGATTDSERATAFVEWLERFIIASLYSGAIPQRQILGLDLLLLFAHVFGVSTALTTPHVVTSLLNLLVSAWDVIRTLAFDALALFFHDNTLPGYTTRTQLVLLVQWALALCGSAQQRESDAGGLFMRLLFLKCTDAIAAFRIDFQALDAPAETVSTASSPSSSSSLPSQIAFVQQLTRVILVRLSDNSSLYDITLRGDVPLVHGLLLSLRYCLESVDFQALEQTGDLETIKQWRPVLSEVFTSVWRAMRVALAVVGDATAGNRTADLPDALCSSANVVGEVNSLPLTATIPLRVDCRGHLILDDEHSRLGGGDDADASDDTEQRAVVGSWLAARECGAIVDVILRRVPLPSSSDDTDASSGFLSFADVQQGGEMLLNALFELKHKGAVATAYTAFESVCRSFLAHSERSAAIGALPSTFAELLLTRLERSEQHFILRRSSGFAFSFVAILRAEPRNAAAVILPIVMTHLLRLAGLDTDAMEPAKEPAQQQHLRWRARVHALNILKLICQDAVLADDVGGFVADMFALSVCGFDCSSWAVRNSSMMLFAAAAQRAIGDKRIADGATHVKVSGRDVFARFPTLCGFLLDALRKCLAVETSSTAPPPPGLFPILMFLSRFKPSDDDDDEEEEESDETTSLTAFVPLVMRCAAQSTMAIRQMAAKVLATITRDADAVDLIKSLIAQLPRGVRSASTASHAFKTTGMTTNNVHGVLLQIQFLVTKLLALDARSIAAHRIDARRAAVVTDIQQLVARDLVGSKRWLWTSATLASRVLQAVYVEIVATFVAFCATQSQEALDTTVNDALQSIFQQCVVDLSTRSATAASLATVETPALIPGSYVTDRALVAMLFSSWRLLRPRELDDANALDSRMVLIVEQLLQSRVLEIRKRTLKQLAHALDGGGKHTTWTLTLLPAALASLRVVLATQFGVETHPKCRARQLELLVTCAALDRSRDASSMLLPAALRDATQAALLGVLQQSADANVLAPAMELLALFVCENRYGNLQVCRTLAHEIHARASANETLAMRHAAARAMAKSGFLLLQAPAAEEALVAIVVDCWRSALQLLQDDDVRTRALVRDAVQQALRLSTNEKEQHAVSDTVVLPAAVAYVVEQFRATAAGATALATLLLTTTDAATVLRTYAGVEEGTTTRGGDWSALCDKIFEAESSNYFMEPELLAQLLVFYLFVAPASRATEATSDVLTALRIQLLERLVDVLTLLNREDPQEHWIGGSTYYASVFAPLLSLLAAGVALVCGTRSENETALATHIAALAQTCAVRFETLHPLMRRALKLLQTAEDSDASTASNATELLFLTPYWQQQ